MTVPTRTRFAPSPTGFLHLGNARTALFNALAARHAGGQFLLRVEDTDAERSRPEYVDALCEDLVWLGVEWNGAPEMQSERSAIYNECLERLFEMGQAYRCFCSPETLAATRRAQLASGQPPRYPGTCRDLDADDIDARLERGDRPAWRFRVPGGLEVTFDDVVRGEQRFATDTIGDFIIRRADGTPAFFFSNALDDALMEVSLVLRGEDHLANTPRQILLLEALGLTPPRYGHLGLLVGPDGAPLSKRHGSASLRDLQSQGLLPRAVLNYLARLGHSYRTDPGCADFATLAADFELDRFSAGPAQFDYDQLLHWQKEAVLQVHDDALWKWLRGHRPSGDEIAGLVPAADRTHFVQVIRDNIVNPAEALDWARAFYSAEDVSDAASREAISAAGGEFFRHALALPECDFRTFAKQLSDAAGVKGKSLYMPLRAALTGHVHGPELVRVWDLLGSGRIRERLEFALRLSESL